MGSVKWGGTGGFSDSATPVAAHPASNQAGGNGGGDGSARRTDGDGESRPGRSRCCAGLKRDIYPDFSVQHFYEQVTKQHANVYDADIFNCSHLTAPK